MILGGYTFAKIPTGIPQVIQKGIDVAIAKTIGGVASFAWDASYVGETVSLQWSLMTTAQYASLQAIYVAGVPVTFDPDDGSGLTFTVIIPTGGLRGAVHINRADSAGNYRKDVTLNLVITAEL